MDNNKGSMSIEAAIAFPIFLFTMLFMICLSEIFAAKAAIYEGCIETAEYMAEYAYLMDSMSDGDMSKDYMAALPVAIVKFQEYVDEEALLEKYIVGGRNGISFLGSAFPDDKGYIDLKVNYFIHIDIPLFGSKSKLCSEHIRQRAYLGYKGTEKKEPVEKEDDPYVYVAKNGVVYHTTRACTYLLPDVHGTTLSSARTSGYTSCEYCGSEAGSLVFVTPDGERYHSDRYCSRLKRNVQRKRLSEVNLPPCSKCGGG
ncbi:MAG: hypothetical protein J5517_05020 [Eubacterium sp.]|nr:hypothetical protein [Eubacterium sp.]